MANNAVTTKVIDILIPYFGADMAQGSLMISCMKYGFDRENLISGNLPKIAEDIETRMKIFLGTEKAKAVANLILAIKE